MPDAFRETLQDLRISLSRQDAILSKRNLFATLILIGLIFYVSTWQYNFAFNKDLDYSQYGIIHSCGVSFSDPEHIFTYGIYYWGLFPAFPDRSQLPKEFQNDALFFSKEGARRIYDLYGYAIKMDIGGTFRMGNVLNLWLPYFVALAKGTTKDVNFIPVNATYFILSLLFLLIYFWRYGRGLLGFILVLLIGSYPFLIYSVYQQDNIFSYMISTLVFSMAFFAPFIFDVKIKPVKQVLTCAAAGILIGIASLMRADCFSAFLPCVLAVFLYRPINFKSKLMLVVVMFFTFYGSVSILHSFFDYKYTQAQRVITEKGGQTLKGVRLKSHVFWHSIWCGMYDFDKKYKHNWGDFFAEYHVKPILEKKYHREVGPLVYHNRPVDYYMPGRFPEYDMAMRDLVFSDIAKDPVWYLDIIKNRIKRIFAEAVKPRISFITGNTFVLPYNIFFYGLLIIMLIISSSWKLLKLILFSAGSATVPIVITTFSNYHYYSIIHLVVAASFIYVVIKVCVFIFDKYIAKKEIPQNE